MSNGKLKQAWADMKQRCNNKNIKSYKFYGARGITYCSEWEEFGPFEKWALENGFENTLSLDRIDVDGNKLVLRDIMGDERVVEGRILMVDLANSIVKLSCE